jgi:hypothetical protein
MGSPKMLPMVADWPKPLDKRSTKSLLGIKRKLWSEKW